jgi:hypothetical protein
MGNVQSRIRRSLVLLLCLCWAPAICAEEALVTLAWAYNGPIPGGWQLFQCVTREGPECIPHLKTGPVLTPESRTTTALYLVGESTTCWGVAPTPPAGTPGIGTTLSNIFCKQVSLPALPAATNLREAESPPPGQVVVPLALTWVWDGTLAGYTGQQVLRCTVPTGGGECLPKTPLDAKALPLTQRAYADTTADLSAEYCYVVAGERASGEHVTVSNVLCHLLPAAVLQGR